MQKDSVVCRYMLSSQNLVIAFWYRRYRVQNCSMVPLDQDINGLDTSVSLDVFSEGGDLISTVTTHQDKPLSQLRENLNYMEVMDLPEKFHFVIDNQKVMIFQIQVQYP